MPSGLTMIIELCPALQYSSRPSQRPLLSERMGYRSKLQTEKQQAEENKKITKEEISKSLLENTEIGIVYEEGKKVSLFDVDNVDNSLNENKKVEVKLEQPKQVEKVEEKIDIKPKEIISEAKEIIKELPKEKEISEAKELIQKVSEKEIREKKQSEVFNQLDALFSGTDEAEDNSSRDYDIKQK